MATLQLYIKDDKIHEDEVVLTPYDDEMSFEQACQVREMEVKHATERMRLMYLRVILKYQFDYYIVLSIQSKMNNQSISEDLWQETLSPE